MSLYCATGTAELEALKQTGVTKKDTNRDAKMVSNRSEAERPVLQDNIGLLAIVPDSEGACLFILDTQRVSFK